jgi:hypothetical protein
MVVLWQLTPDLMEVGLVPHSNLRISQSLLGGMPRIRMAGLASMAGLVAGPPRGRVVSTRQLGDGPIDRHPMSSDSHNLKVGPPQ